MLAIVVPISWVARGLPGAPDADPAGKGAEQVTTPVAPPTHAIESGLDLQRIFDAIGYPFRLDDGSGVAAVTEQEAIRLGQGDESLGLVWVGQRRAVGDNEATNGQATAWRLSWVIVAAATIHAFPGPSKYNAPSDTPSPNSALTQSVAFVDAITGNVYAGFVI
jgi:hypothetical protein